LCVCGAEGRDWTRVVIAASGERRLVGGTREAGGGWSAREESQIGYAYSYAPSASDVARRVEPGAGAARR
jgi:hypothetical protein